MTSLFGQPFDPCGQVEMLIPWYVNGTLSATESLRVERHLATCRQCRTSCEVEKIIERRMHDSPNQFTALPLTGWKQLASRLDMSTGLVRRLTTYRRLVSTLLLAQTAAIAILVIALVQTPPFREVPLYRTLSDTSPTRYPTGAELRVVFSETTTVAQIRTWLDRIDGKVSDGPSPNNVYTVTLTSTADSNGMGPDAAASWLRQQPGVLFAESVGVPANN